jgi:putative membrane protein
VPRVGANEERIMIRLLVSGVLHLLANAVGLALAALLLSGFSISTLAFVAVVVVFTIVEVVLGPFVFKIALKNLPALSGGIALVTTFVGLLITNLVSEGLTINGITTWVVAVLIVWLGGVLGAVVLPLVLFKNVLEQRRGSPA